MQAPLRSTSWTASVRRTGALAVASREILSRRARARPRQSSSSSRTWPASSQVRTPVLPIVLSLHRLTYPPLLLLPGISVRVPVTNVSLVDLTVTLSSDVDSVEDLLAPFRRPSDDVVSQHVLEVSDLELVSSDYLGTRASAVVDAKTCSVLGKRVAKILAFYDNEAGYALRASPPQLTLRVAQYISADSTSRLSSLLLNRPARPRCLHARHRPRRRRRPCLISRTDPSTLHCDLLIDIIPHSLRS
jgi:hypothetical protein